MRFEKVTGTQLSPASGHCSNRDQGYCPNSSMSSAASPNTTMSAFVSRSAGKDDITATYSKPVALAVVMPWTVSSITIHSEDLNGGSSVAWVGSTPIKTNFFIRAQVGPVIGVFGERNALLCQHLLHRPQMQAFAIDDLTIKFEYDCS